MNSQSTIPLVTVIMPAYNMGAFIGEAIDSVIGQSLSDWELLVIDDCSTDNTRNIVADYAEKDPRIRLVANDENMGVARTRNRGLTMSRGRFVALLDSDDYWKPQMLEKMVARAEETGADIIYCSYELVDEQGKKVCNDFIVPETTTFEESIIRSVITCSTVLLTAQLVASYRFPTDMYHEDIALWFQILREGGIVCGITDILAAYRQRTESRSAGKVKSACRRWTIYRKHLKMPLVKSLVTMAKYGCYGLIKYKRT